MNNKGHYTVYQLRGRRIIKMCHRVLLLFVVGPELNIISVSSFALKVLADGGILANKIASINFPF